MSMFSRHYVSFFASAVLILAVLGCGGLNEALNEGGSGSGSGSGWEQQLAGKKVWRVKSSGSFSDTYNFWFCSSGEYFFKSETLGMSSGGAGDASFNSENVERGRWSVASSTLTLEPEGAARYEFQLSESTDQDMIRFDGTPFRVSPSSECP